MTRPIGRGARRVALAFALALPLGWLAFRAGAEGLSNFFAQSAHLELERWPGAGAALPEEDAARVQDTLAQSLHYSPNNPWPLEEMGSVQLRRAAAAAEPRLAAAAARSAYVDFRLALVQRPASAFAWANLALSKLYLNQPDAEFAQALARAQQLGPWEPEVQQAALFAGLAAWPRLGPAAQAALLETMQRGAQRDAAKIAAIAASFQRIALFCGLREQGAQGREICRLRGAAPAAPAAASAAGGSR